MHLYSGAAEVTHSHHAGMVGDQQPPHRSHATTSAMDVTELKPGTLHMFEYVMLIAALQLIMLSVPELAQ